MVSRRVHCHAGDPLHTREETLDQLLTYQVIHTNTGLRLAGQPHGIKTRNLTTMDLVEEPFYCLNNGGFRAQTGLFNSTLTARKNKGLNGWNATRCTRPFNFLNGLCNENMAW